MSRNFLLKQLSKRAGISVPRYPPSSETFAQVYSTLMWVPSEDMRLGRVEAGDVGPWWEKEDEEEG